MSGSPDVLVVGGGIVGLALARELAGRGIAVELVDRGTPGAAAPAASASFAAAGMLAPLAEVPEPGAFFEACRAARDLWRSWGPDLEAESDLRLDLDTSGAIVLDPDPAPGGHLERLADAAAELGEPASWLARDDLEGALPGLALGIVRGLLLPGEHRVDSRRACRALRRSIDLRGVRVSAGVEVRRIATSSSGICVEGENWRRRAGSVVIATGAWSAALEGLPRLPIQPIHGQMIELSGIRWPWLGTLRGPELYAVRRAGGRLAVGATVEQRGFDTSTRETTSRHLHQFVSELFPDLHGLPCSATWAGLRPGTPDGLPLLGRWGGPGVWVASGHYRNGILLAPWSAREMSGALLAGGPPAHLDPFSPARFGISSRD